MKIVDVQTDEEFFFDDELEAEEFIEEYFYPENLVVYF